MKPPAGETAPVRICLLGASGLVGSEVIHKAADRVSVHIVGVGRHELGYPLPDNVEMRVGVPIDWPQLIHSAKADVLVCALGTTIKAAGSQAQFKAIDYDLVRFSAEAAREAGIKRMILVSSVGADKFSSNFYLATKAATEASMGKLSFTRLDILRPSLLRGKRREPRLLEGIGQALSPIADHLVMHGSLRRYRSISAMAVAKAIMALAHRKSQGRFIHEHDGIRAAANMASWHR